MSTVCTDDYSYSKHTLLRKRGSTSMRRFSRHISITYSLLIESQIPTTGKFGCNKSDAFEFQGTCDNT